MKSYKLKKYSIDIEDTSVFNWFHFLPVFSIQHKYWYEWKINIGFLKFNVIIYIINDKEYNNNKYYE